MPSFEFFGFLFIFAAGVSVFLGVTILVKKLAEKL